MRTQHAPIDPVERDIAAVQLDELALAHNGQPWTAWKDAVLQWHLRALATAQAQAWIPGLSNHQDPVVEEALNRFHSHHVRIAISRLRVENIELRRKVLDATKCALFYASGATDAGRRANTVLRELLTPPAIENMRGSSH